MDFTPEAKAAWLAALVDGEGSIYMSRHARADGYVRFRSVVVIASNTDYRLMEAIREAVGVGQIYEHVVSNTAKSHNPRKRRQWTYRLNNEQIGEWLPIIRPYLVLKGEQADLIVEAIRLKRLRDSRFAGSITSVAGKQEIGAQLEAICARTRELNSRGRE